MNFLKQEVIPIADPVTITKVALEVINRLKDEESRQKTLVLVLLPIIFLVLILASPLAIFLALEEDGQSVAATMRKLERELLQKVEYEKYGADEYKVIFDGSEDDKPIINVQDVLAIFAVRAGLTDALERPDAVVKLTSSQKLLLVGTFWDMNTITTSIEEKEIPYDGPQDYDPYGYPIPTPMPTKHTTKTILIDSKNYDEAAARYNFNDYQSAILDELMHSKYMSLFIEMLGVPEDADDFTLQAGGATQSEIDNIRSQLPQNLSQSRSAVVTAANSLVGRVRYFWGGKSTAIGWDSRWGQLVEVTSSGSSTTGTTRPFGLDCSGFALWSFVNAGVPASKASAVIGNGTANQWAKSTAITKELLQPGDLAFQAIPGTAKGNHVGIVVGFDSKDEPLIAHCSSSRNDVVVTGPGKTFKYYRKPAIFD